MERLRECLRINSSDEEAFVFLKNLLSNRQTQENFLQSLPEKKRLKAEGINFEELIGEDFFKKTFMEKWREETSPEWERTDKESLLALKEAVLHTITYLVLRIETVSEVPEGWLAKKEELFLLSDFVRFVLSSKKINS